MNMANIGIGVGAFADGFRQGVGLGNTLNETRNKREIDTIRREGLEGAKKQRQQDINKQVDPQLGEQVATRGIDPQSKPSFKVGGETTGSLDQARDIASQNVGDVSDYFMKTAAPKIRDTYMAQGEIEKAQQWDEYLKDRKGEKAVKDWGKAFMAARSGDWDQAASAFGKYYTDYIDDGVEYKGHKTMKDDDGNITGFSISLKDNDTGKSRKVPMTKNEMFTLGMAHNPQVLFENTYARHTAAQDARLEEAQAQRDHSRDLEKIGYREQAKAAYSQNETRQKFDANADILRDAGFTDEEIKQFAPRILGIANTSVMPSEEEIRLEAMKDLRENSFGEFERLSEEEKRRKVDAYVNMVRGISGGGAGRGARSGSSAGRSGAPPILDTETGETINP